MSDKVLKKREQWRIYKPKKTGDGAASKLEMKIVDKEMVGKENKKFSVRDVQLFWVTTKQTGVDTNENASFAWDDQNKTVTLKIGEPDIGEILALLNGHKEQAGSPKTDKFPGGLFHKNENGSATLVLAKFGDGYSLRVSKKIGTNAPVIVSHQITLGEAQVLKVVLESAIRQMYQW